MKWGLWSTTAASNSATPPDGWPEGQAPSTVNDCAREMMAAIATGLQDIQFVDLGFAPTQTSGNTFTVSGTHADVLHYGRRLKINDGASTLYGTIISSTATSNTVVVMRFDTGNSPLDSSLSSFAIGSPSQVNGALPDTVVRDKNYIDNACMDVCQRGLGPFSYSAGVSRPNCTADRWSVGNGLTSAGPTIAINVIQRSAAASNVPALAQAGILFNQALQVKVNNAASALGNTEFLWVGQTIEGYTWRQIAQKPMTLSFWVNSNVTGTYCVRVRNSGGDQSLIQNYAISASGVWERKVISLAKSPSSGTWDYSTGVGLTVQFFLGAGNSLNAGVAGAWSNQTQLVTSLQTNLMLTTGAFSFTGVKLQEGTQATMLNPITYPEELNRCTRYLQIVNGNVVMPGIGITTGQGVYDVPFQNVMRNASLSASLGLGVAVGNLLVTDINNVPRSVSAIASVSSNPMRGTVLVNTVGTPLTAGGGTRLAGSSVGANVTLFVFKSEP